MKGSRSRLLSFDCEAKKPLIVTYQAVVPLPHACSALLALGQKEGFALVEFLLALLW